MEEMKEKLIRHYPFMKKEGKIITSFNRAEVFQKYQNEKLLVMIIGVQGSGKTTYCQRNFSDYNVVNIDNILAEYLLGKAKEFNQMDHVRVHEIFFERVRNILSNKNICIIDTGAVNFSTRVMILDQLKKHYTKVILLMLNPHIKVIKKQIRGQMMLRAREGLWKEVNDEYDLLQYQIDEGYIQMGVDEVYTI